MATFHNYATLTYRGGSAVSNLVTGELVEALSVTKTAVVDQYAPGGSVTYAVSIVNSAQTAVSNLTLSDDLGAFAVEKGTAAPLAYTAGSLKLYSGGILQTPPPVTVGPPLLIQGLTVPGDSSLLLIYQAKTTEYAPLDSTGQIVNTATVSGGNLAVPITASATVQPESGVSLSISKFISPSVVTEDGTLTYTFLISNCGCVAAGVEEGVTVADIFDPVLNDLTVTLNGTALAPGQYSYAPATGEFSTTAGAITVPAASATQDEQTGIWTLTPGTATLEISGTV